MIETLQEEIDSLQSQASELTNLSKMVNKEEKPANYSQMLKALRSQWQSSSALERQKLNKLNNHAGLAKAENSILSPNVNVAQGFTFSGTDNGHHTMTDTVAFTLKRFKFHPELYNQYQVLGDVQNDDPHLADILKRYHSDAIDSECMDENVSYLDLPNSFKVKSEDIDFECGNWRRRRKLERDKKRAFEGQIV
ncbi:hypothetical protein G6F70_003336 [Rhizopus microsporus]|uniref:Uncharacterized protein n=1 Tax=Rhizopus microsporus TaxID=58291 RepID=A0A1X0SEQ6_RHIZD|nr:hypothetical protein G6F71_003073 [Rhizopus microsporus]KAG1201262.1 hypothetical protein G6F70_003336 [Rhizopus microsporus]KAG1213456.1 hypothetical protein G6F69_002818 [Rhizopus microsporus]KAG1235608.1 hypothetical protein G6F67_002620 [Rhizopus microsporus]KAG1259168.1 hypothetical protein G6F68_008293 [Rhizopus microsporus]